MGLLFLSVLVTAVDHEDDKEERTARVTTAARIAAGALIGIPIWIFPLKAQDSTSPHFERLTSNAAFNVSVPVSQAATFASAGWGFTYGAGYNFNRHQAIVGEIMWNSLYPSNAALAPIRAALQDNSINGHGNLVAVTANYRLQFAGKVHGTYLMAGGGMYYRQASLSRSITVGESVTCNPAWLWWGFTCTSGNVTSNQTLASSSSTVLGGSVAIGYTVAISDSGYKFYVESRYDYAPNKHVATQFVPIAIGIRF